LAATAVATEAATIIPSAEPPTATATPPAAVDLWVTVDKGLNLRSEANVKSGTVITIVVQGGHLTALGDRSEPDAEKYIWQQVRTDHGREGWVAVEAQGEATVSRDNPNRAAVPTPSTAAATPTTLDLWVTVEGGLNLRSEPVRSSNIITTVAPGGHLTALGARQDSADGNFIWQQVRADDAQVGWAAVEAQGGANVSETNPNPSPTPPAASATPAPTSAPTMTPTPTVTPTPGLVSSTGRDRWVNAPDGLNLRDDARVSARLVRLLNYGEHLTALERNVGPDADGITWQQVQADDGQSGWVSAVYLALTLPPTLTPTPTKTP
jgi:uncharacterized protein YgiM (DUF1202 family)